jgi:hypothetical protein
MFIDFYIDQNARTVTFNMTVIMQTTARFQEKGKVSLGITGDQIAHTVFVPIANCDRRSLASAVR